MSDDGPEHFGASVMSIPHKHQRYETCGDWSLYRDSVQVTVSQMGDWRYEALVAVHELVEALICRHRGISEFEVTRFDKAFEAQRKDGDKSEPGDDPASPYRREHQFATRVEKMLAEELAVDWNAYERAIEELG